MRTVTELPDPADAHLDQVLHPRLFYDRPADVVADTELTLDERRAILSSWASDACAVESAPALRKPPLARAPVTYDEIMDALMELDRQARASRRKGPAGPSRRPKYQPGCLNLQCHQVAETP